MSKPLAILQKTGVYYAKNNHSNIQTKIEKGLGIQPRHTYHSQQKTL